MYTHLYINSDIESSLDAEWVTPGNCQDIRIGIVLKASQAVKKRNESSAYERRREGFSLPSIDGFEANNLRLCSLCTSSSYRHLTKAGCQSCSVCRQQPATAMPSKRLASKIRPPITSGSSSGIESIHFPCDIRMFHSIRMLSDDAEQTIEPGLVFRAGCLEDVRPVRRPGTETESSDIGTSELPSEGV